MKTDIELPTGSLWYMSSGESKPLFIITDAQKREYFVAYMDKRFDEHRTCNVLSSIVECYGYRRLA